MRSMLRILSIVIITILGLHTAQAQNGGFAGSANRIGFGPKAMGMGNAMTATTSQGSFAHYNPALSALKQDFTQVQLGVSSLRFDRVHQTVGASFQLPPSAGLSVDLIRSGVNNIDGRTASGYSTGEFETSEYQLLAAFGMRMSDKLKAGIGFKLNYAKLHDDLKSSTSLGIDIGLLYHISEFVNFGFTIQDMLSEYSFNSSELYGLDQARNVVNKFPTRIKWGLAYQTDVFTLSGDFEIQVFNSEINTEETFLNNGIPQTFESVAEISTNTQQFRIGGAWNAHERFTLRAGYNLPDISQSSSWGLSTGFSLNLPFDKFSPSIDYAFVVEPNRVATIHVFALSLHL